MKSNAPQFYGALAWSVICLTGTVSGQQNNLPPSGNTEQQLVPAGAIWRFLDDGSNQGEAWRQPGFQDASWRFGPAQLGYGDGDEATVVSFGPSASAKHITTYFRQSFEVADASHIDRLILRLVRDDGAVVYLNGHELVRDNMPDGPVSHQTPATTAIGTGENEFNRYDLAAADFVTGRNVLAVEVHQANPASSDVSFDLELFGVLRGGEPLPVVWIQASVGETIEPSPNTRVQSGEFTITRTGNTNEPLNLFLSFGGTAEPGKDYGEIEQFHRMPEGETTLRVLVGPFDDALVEGDETVVATLEVPPIDSLPNYQIDPNRRQAEVIIHDNDAAELPAVSVFASPWRTAEPCPVCLVAPAELFFERTGATTEPLVVYFQTDGTAASGEDYEALPVRIEIPAGQARSQIRLLARDDQRVEGPEVVRVRLTYPPTDTPPTYTIDSNDGEALVMIDDGEPGAPDARLDLVEPIDGSHFPQGARLSLSAIGVYTRGEIYGPVEFYAGDAFIGRSEVQATARPTIPGLPSVHTIIWTNPPAGSHSLTARAEISFERWVTSPPMQVNVGADPAPTVVSIWAEDSAATEIDITPAINPARFSIARTGDLRRDLLVFYSVHGSATAGDDYRELDSPVRIPAGAASAELELVAAYDEIREGMETVHLRLEPSPLVGPLPDYEIAAWARDATAIILDHGAASEPDVEIVWPKEGDRFRLPATVEIVAAAFHPTRDMARVDFYAGDMKIGDSWIVFDRAVAGGLIVHRLEWDAPTPGAHALTARSFEEGSGTTATAISPPVHITVEPDPATPRVRLEATGRIAEESSEPLRRIALVGEFTISRTGPTNQAMSVFVHYSGTATPGVDYPHLPWWVTIPAGSSSTVIRVEPVPDREREGIETLVAALSHCPPETDPPLGMPCFAGFEIEPAYSQATVFIRDDGITQASLRITEPPEGSMFRPGQIIPIQAIAIDLEGYLSRVEFRDGDRQIGVSEITFIRAPDPGTPIHHSFEWRDPAPGAHELTARALRADGTQVQSIPVRITVEGAAGQPPQIAIVRPTSGASFPPDAPIEIVVETRDPDGYVRKVEFFADGRKIGEQNLEFIRPPEPGQGQTFTFVWRQALPGSHDLTAQATDDAGSTGMSASVPIQVWIPDGLPTVMVTSRDAFAVEPSSNIDLNTATFRIRRFGPTNQTFTVHYSLGGGAQNGVDFETLSGRVAIPAGKRSALVTVRPLADNALEGIETVILRLEEPPGDGPTFYQIGFPRRAVALISDPATAPRPGEPRCIRLHEGFWHVCFPAESGRNFRVEGSADLRSWETLFVTPALESAVHFVDDQAGSRPHRFYRLAPEPVAETDE